MACVFSGASQLDGVPSHGKLGNEEERKSCSGCGLFMELAANLVSMGIFVDIWYWSKAEVGDTSLFLCFWLKRTEERRIDSLPCLAKGGKIRSLEYLGLLTESNNVNFIVIFPSSPEKEKRFTFTANIRAFIGFIFTTELKCGKTKYSPSHCFHFGFCLIL